jgi:Flp pilus assembly protein TadG
MRRVKQGRRRRGIATVELAVCMPVIALLVVATIEACSMIFLKQSLSVAAYEGVRAAISAGGNASTVRSTCNQILKDRRVKDATITIAPEQFDTLNPGQYVDVTISAPCGSNNILPVKFYRGQTLSETASMMIEFSPSSP